MSGNSRIFPGISDHERPVLKKSSGKYEEILRLVGEMLTQAHFSPQQINDDFSQKIFNKYLSDLDPEKYVFAKRHN